MRTQHDEWNDRRRKGVEISCYWQDADVLEIQVKATNGIFAGLAFPYIAHGDLETAARRLDGFPVNFMDAREMEFGDSRDRFAGGYVLLKFTCRDSAGHCAVEVQVRSKNESHTEPRWNRAPQGVTLIAGVDASAIDEFVKDLRRLGETKKGTAWLGFSVG